MSEVEVSRDNKESREENRGNDVRRGAVTYDKAMPDNEQRRSETNRRAGAAQTSRANAAVAQMANEVELRERGGAQEGTRVATPAAASEYDRVTHLVNEYEQPTDPFGDVSEDAVDEDKKKQSWSERHQTATAVMSFFGGIAGWGGLAASIWAAIAGLEPPVAVDDEIKVDFKPGDVLSCEVLLNDTHLRPIDKTSIELEGADAGSTDKKTKTVAGVGTWTANNLGVIQFTPDSALTVLPGDKIAVGYTVCNEANSARSNVGTLSFVQDPPKATTTTTTTPAPGTTMMPTGTTMSPTGTTMNPTGTTLNPTGTTMNPTGTTMNPTGTTMMPGGTTASPVPVVMNLMQTVKRASAFTIDFNDIARRFASLNLNAASVLLVGANNAGVTSLTVTGQGTFAVSTTAQGVVNFTPESGFAGFPAPVKFTIANTASVRSAPFQYTFLGVVVPTATPVTVLEDLPKIDFDARSPVAGQQPPDVAEGFAKVSVVVLGTMAMPGSARPGGLAIDPNSVEIVGPVSDDGSMPSYVFVTPKKKLVVDGEGTWTVTASGNIEFSSAKNFVRWPTPIGYTVKDTDGNLSNAALISINPELKKLQDGINNFLTKTDDAFWAEFDAEVIKNANITNDGDGLKQIRLIVHTLWSTIYASMNTTTRTAIYRTPRYLEHDYQQIKMKWMTAKLSKAGLLTATDEITNTLTLLGAVPLGTRLIRLEVIRRLITDVFPPSTT